jgi:hypothetical protein
MRSQSAATNPQKCFPFAPRPPGARRAIVEACAAGMSGLPASFSGLRYAANLCRAAPLMIAAPFSAIMMVGALVLVELTAGMIEA